MHKPFSKQVCERFLAALDACTKFTLYSSNFLYNNIKITAERRNMELRQHFIIKGLKGSKSIIRM
jgi:hypothetical protein